SNARKSQSRKRSPPTRTSWNKRGRQHRQRPRRPYPQLLSVIPVSAKRALVAFAVRLCVTLAVLMLVAECAVVAVVGIVKAAARIRVEGLASQHFSTRDSGAGTEAAFSCHVHASPTMIIAAIVA